MEQVHAQQLWRKGAERHIITGITGAIAHMKDEHGARSEVPITSLVAGDGGWELVPTVEQLREKHNVSERVARRMLAINAAPENAQAAVDYLEKADYPEDVRASLHFEPVLDGYSDRLSPNPDAVSFIIGAVRESEERAPSGRIRDLAEQRDNVRELELPPEEARTIVSTKLREPPTEEQELADMAESPLVQEVVDEFRAIVAPLYDAVNIKAGGVPATVAALREVESALGTLVPPLVTEIARLYPRIHALLYEAAEALDELYGPAVVGYRCDECERCVTQHTLRSLLGADYQYAAHRDLGIKVHYEGTRTEHYLNPHVECHEHGPMRDVLMRVTADDPESLTKREVQETHG